MIFRFHLNFPGCSGLAIQAKVLTYSDIRDAKLQVLRMAGKDATVFEVQELVKVECLKRMITHVSDGPAQPPVTKDTSLVAVSGLDWENPAHKFYFEKTFANPMDMDVLDDLYRKYHELTPQQRGDLEAKIVPLSLD